MSDTCRYYTNYKIDDVPPHPGDSWTRFVCLSDTHSHTSYDVPDGDVLLHGGDLSYLGSYSNLRKTIDWLQSLPHEFKVIIAGNHDICLDSSWIKRSYVPTEDFDNARAMVRSEEMREAGLIYLEREKVDIVTKRGIPWSIYGSPAAPIHLDGAFQYRTKEEAEAEWSQIPIESEILLSHTPPLGILDLTSRGKHVGCPILLSRLETLTLCRLHVFGHIHEAQGSVMYERSGNTGGRKGCTVAVNAAVASRRSQPIIVDLRKDIHEQAAS